MAMDWSRQEVEFAVRDYLAMLDLELSGQPYNKADHRRRLRPLLENRSEGSVEFKHQNISAALIRSGFPYISGYKPRWNYQRPLLDEIVAAQLALNPGLQVLVEADVVRSVGVPTVENILTALTDPPDPQPVDMRVREPNREYPRTPINYLEREARNRQLGIAGEQFVVNFEIARLTSLKKEGLASRVEHVSRVRGDGEGFDILSFEQSGEERLIEVKTTKYGRETPFFVSDNEVVVAEARAAHYHLYRVFNFRSSPKLFMLAGALTSTCVLTPSTYVANVA